MQGFRYKISVRGGMSCDDWDAKLIEEALGMEGVFVKYPKEVPCKSYTFLTDANVPDEKMKAILDWVGGKFKMERLLV